MSGVVAPDDRARRYESRAIFLTGAVYVAIAAVVEWLTAARSAPLALYALLCVALLARYVPWSRLSFYSPPLQGVPWLLLGTAIVVGIAVILESRAALFFYLILAEGCLVFLRPYQRVLWSLGVIALSFATYQAFLGRRANGWPEGALALLEILPVFLMLAVAVQLIFRQENQRAQVESLLTKLSEANRRLEDHAAQAEALAVAEERTRLAHEIHDSLGHCLTALDFQMELLSRLPESERESRQEIAARCRALAKDSLAELRRAVGALRPGALETFSLPEAIAALVADFRNATQTKVDWRVDGEPVPIAPSSGIALYRAAQEALTNVTRHANARQVAITLRFAHETVVLAVEDDGRGGEVKPGFGLQGLRERAEAVGGELRAGSGAERGFRVEMVLPR